MLGLRRSCSACGVPEVRNPRRERRQRSAQFDVPGESAPLARGLACSATEPNHGGPLPSAVRGRQGPGAHCRRTVPCRTTGRPAGGEPLLPL